MAIDEIENQIGKLNAEVVHKEKATLIRLEKERTDSLNREEKLDARLRAATIDGVYLNLGGVFYLGLGIILTSIPDAACVIL